MTKSTGGRITAGAVMSALALSGCGGLSVNGVPILPAITNTPQYKFQPSSKYQGLDVRDDATLTRYLELIKSVNRTVVEDEYGIFYSEVRGMQVAQFHIAKEFEGHFRQSVAKGTVFVYPFYLIKLPPGVQPGGCGNEWIYDRVRTERWRSFFTSLDFRVRPLNATDELDRLEQDVLKAHLAGSTVPEEEQRKRFAAATGPSTLFMSDGTQHEYRNAVFETKRIDGRVMSRSCPGYSLPTSIKLGFFADQIARTAREGSAEGAISAYCSVINFDVIRNSRQFVEFPVVEAKRAELDRRALSFCEDAVKAVKLSRKMESQRLR